MSLQRSLIVLFAVVLIAAVIPAGMVVERRLEAEIEEQVRADLVMAPALVEERRRQLGDAIMMHAKEIASAPGLADALLRGDEAAALRRVEEARAGYGEQSILLTPDGRVLAGPTPPASLIAEAMAGAMPVAVVPADTLLFRLGLAPILGPDGPVAVAGVASGVGPSEAGALAGLTRSDVLIVHADGTIAAASRDDASDPAVARDITSRDTVDGVVDIGDEAGGRRLVATAPLGEGASVLFVRDLADDMAVVGMLRRIGTLNFAIASVLALALAALFSMVLTRPVRALASAADRLAGGDFHAPIPRPVLSEVGRMADAFVTMRQALAARLDDLERANRELADRQARLAALQAELIQRDRLAAAGQLVTQLAHEIRNPVANVRNCLELIRRRLDADDVEAIEFADLAIDELLRMHELAEQMLDLHRPRDNGAEDADLMAIARDVVALARVGAPPDLVVTATGEDGVRAAATSDAIKQVTLNLVRNAREAMKDRGRIDLVVQKVGDSAVIEVRDDGPGIPANVMPHLFDPFFTTKGDVHGVGLGLFVAEGLIRGFGGRITAVNRRDRGARFRIELPAPARPDAAAHRTGESAS